MRRIILLFFFGWFANSPAARSQSMPLIKLETLNKRINNGNDTVFIINFWATWCIPCLKELPYFEQFSKIYSKEKVKVILVSLDFKSVMNKTVKPMVRKLKLKNEVILLDESDQQAYIDSIDQSWSGSLPATLIVNKTKNKRQFHEGEYTFDELVKIYQQNK